MSETSAAERTRVVVVGAGQAGLAAAWHLRRLGLEPGRDLVVLDRGPGTGGAWQHRWASLRLGTAHRLADLPGMTELGLSFGAADRDEPARDVVARYYARYEDAYELRVRRPVEVTRVTDATDDGGGLLVSVTGASGPLVTDVLVNATGTWGAPFVPAVPGREAFRGRQLHTAEWRDAKELRGLRVVVVGGGTSAVGHLLDLEGVAASTTWATRRRVRWHEGPELDVEHAVAAVAEQDRAARAGRALPSIVSGTGLWLTRASAAARERGVLVDRPMFTRIEQEAVVWPDGTRTPADAIVWATGWRPELRHLAPLGLRGPEGGVPVEDGVALRDPRVLLAGYGPQASTLGAARAARRTARAVLARLAGCGGGAAPPASRRAGAPPRVPPRPRRSDTLPPREPHVGGGPVA